jgi:hypothetical protein
MAVPTATEEAQWQNQIKRPVTMEELLVSSLAQADALAKLLIEKGLITREEFLRKISEEGRRISECYTKSKR